MYFNNTCHHRLVGRDLCTRVPNVYGPCGESHTGKFKLQFSQSLSAHNVGDKIGFYLYLIYMYRSFIEPGKSAFISPSCCC